MRILTLTGLVVALGCSVPASAQQAAAPTPADCSPADDVRFVCGLQAPEDLVVVPGEQWVVASAYSGTGGVYLIRVSDRTSTVAYPAATARERLDAKVYNTCPGPPDAATKAKFQTHGLYLQEGTDSVHRLYVVLHGGRESIEVFELDARPATPALTWVGCAVAPDPIGLNSVRALPDGGFIATDFLARGADSQGRMKQMQSGEKNGALWEWHTATGWQKVPGSEAAGANGLEISSDDRWFYVAAWGSQSFFRLSRNQSQVTRDEVPLGFRVDNIRWARDGSILAAGQGGPASVVVKIDPKTLTVREVLRRTNVPGFGAGTVAVEVGGDYWVGSFRGDRLAIFPAGR
jgi:hypothetical protein